MKKHNTLTIGSIISGTCRAEDIIPELLYCADELKLTRRERRAVQAIRSRANAEGYFDTEEADWDREELENILEGYTPPYFYLGAHPGDGADLGVWLCEESIQDARHDGTLPDADKVPKGYTGQALEVNDHGNTTLFQYAQGRRRIVWSIV